MGIYDMEKKWLQLRDDRFSSYGIAAMGLATRCIIEAMLC
jgi:hypothetical protein